MTRLYLGALTVFAALAAPSVSLAAQYAYVSQTGEVLTIEAATAIDALIAAPNIDENSGVMLINDQSDEALVGDMVPGV